MADPVRDFLLGDDGDLANVNGDFALVAGSAAVTQGIGCRTRMFEGECFLDEAQGVPWITEILIKSPDPLNVRELLRVAIADTPDVTDVVGAQLLQLPQRKGSIDYQVATVYSPDLVAGTVKGV